jgi:hypothetical protein
MLPGWPGAMGAGFEFTANLGGAGVGSKSECSSRMVRSPREKDAQSRVKYAPFVSAGNGAIFGSFLVKQQCFLRRPSILGWA